MEYDWEEIFKNKTDKELFEIFSGKSFLPESAIPYAKKELEKRNFDFKNIDLYLKTWKLHSLEEDIDSREDSIYKHKPVSLSYYIFFSIFGILVVLFVFRNCHLPNKVLIIGLSIATNLFIVGIKYFIDKVINNYQSKKLTKLTSNKSSILNDLDNMGLQFEKQRILEDLKSQSLARYKREKQINNIVFIIATLGLIIYLIIINRK